MTRRIPLCFLLLLLAGPVFAQTCPPGSTETVIPVGSTQNINIAGSNQCIHIQGTAANGAFSDAVQITGNGTGGHIVVDGSVIVGAAGDDGLDMDSTLAPTIIVNGLIDTTASLSTSPDAIATTGGLVVVHAGARVISGGRAGIAHFSSSGINANFSALRIENHGLIQGPEAIQTEFSQTSNDVVINDGTILSPAGLAIDLLGGDDLVDQRGGTITGGGGTAISFDDGNDRLLLSGGTINGNVNGEGGLDVFDISGGIVNGTLDGGADNDTINFLGDFTHAGTIQNFETGNVNAGRIGLNGTATITNLSVNGGILGGIGQINGTVVARSGGSIGPGNSIGTLTINGNVTFDAGSTLIIEFQGRPGAVIADRLDVIGGANTATIRSGAILRPVLLGGILQSGDRATVLMTANPAGVVGTFDVQPISAALGIKAEHLADRVILEIVRNPYRQLGQTPNQRAIGAAIDGALEGASGDFLELVLSLDRLPSPGDVSAALTMLDPEFHDVGREVGLMAYRNLLEAVEHRLSDVREGRPTFVLLGDLFGPRRDLVADGGGAPDEYSLPGFSIWAGAYGLLAERDASTDVTDYEVTSTGPRFGWDLRLSEAFSVGMFGGLDFSEADLGRFRGAQAEHRAYSIGATLSYEHPIGLSAHGIVHGGFDRYESLRPIVFGNFVRLAESDHDGSHIGTRLGLEYVHQFGPWGLGPVASLDYLHQGQDAFTERGAGAAGLRVDARDVDSLETGLGLFVRLRDTDPEPGGLTFVPELRAAWIREWLDDDRSLSATFLGGPRFSVTTDDPVRNSVRLGFGLRGHASDWFSFGVDYDATLSSEAQGHSIQGSFEIRF